MLCILGKKTPGPRQVPNHAVTCQAAPFTSRKKGACFESHACEPFLSEGQQQVLLHFRLHSGGGRNCIVLLSVRLSLPSPARTSVCETRMIRNGLRRARFARSQFNIPPGSEIHGSCANAKIFEALTAEMRIVRSLYATTTILICDHAIEWETHDFRE